MYSERVRERERAAAEFSLACERARLSGGCVVGHTKVYVPICMLSIHVCIGCRYGASMLDGISSANTTLAEWNPTLHNEYTMRRMQQHPNRC